MIRSSASICLSVLAAVFVATSALAQAPPPSVGTAPAGEVCITVDAARDTLSPQDRAAALLLVAHQFELAGKVVGPAGCLIPYTVSHVRLGNTIIVSLTGADGHREGKALGLDDLPALYSQMVRSMVTGRPMTGFNVVDRTNVTASQVAPLRVQTESFVYVRLGFGKDLRGGGGPATGFGYRAELDKFGIDVSLLGTQDNSRGPSAVSLVKLEGLYFMKPAANASAYVGGGISYAGSSFGGKGLQGELTVGYEFPRASSLRMFVQADASFPFYKATSETSSTLNGTIGTERRYSPVIAVSVGLGWQRNRRGSR